MIETSNPEIDVADLMRRVRAEAAALKLAREQQTAAGSSSRPRSTAPVRLPMPIAIPNITLPKGVDTKKDRLDQLLQRARQKWEGRRGFQKLIRRMFPRQRPFNRIILEVLAALTKNDRSLANRIQQLTDCVQAQQQTIRALAKRGELDAVWMQANGEDGAPATDLGAVRQHLDALQGQTDRLGAHVINLDNEMRPAALHVQALQGQTDRLGAHVLNFQRELGANTEYLRATQSQVDQLGLQINHLQLEIGRTSTQSSVLQRAVDDLLARRAALENQLARLEDKHSADASFIKAAMTGHSTMIERLVRDGSGAPSRSRNGAAGNASEATSPELDAFYAALRDRVRGSRAEVKQLLRLYLPFMADAAAGSDERPIVDLACSRGEWLELLQEASLVGRGVETNAALLAACRELNLDVQRGDALEYLQSLPAASVGAVCGFRIMEELSPTRLLSLLREAQRVLKPGGAAVFDAANCKNVLVGTRDFYAEPSERQPVMPETAAFMLESVGFANVRITYHSPVSGSPFAGGSKESAALKELFAGPRQFAVVGYVPRAA